MAVHEELVKVVTVVQGDLDKPRTIRLTPHRMRAGLPTVKLADHGHLAGFRGKAEKIDRLGHPLRRVAMQAGGLL